MPKRGAPEAVEPDIKLAKMSREAKADEGKSEQLMQLLAEKQERLEQLDDEMAREIVEIEKRYLHLKRPILDERSAVIKQIDNFWLQAFENHEQLSDLLSDVDLDIIGYLEVLNCQDFENIQLGYTISMHFRPNPFFKNAVLTKEFRLSEDRGELSVHPVEIIWKDPQFAEQYPDSFFVQWFQPTDQLPDIGELLREELFKNPLALFTNTQDVGETALYPGEEGVDVDEELAGQS